MKKLLVFVLMLLPIGLFAQKASLTISNVSEYNLTIKVMRCDGSGCYSQVYIPAKQSRTIYFSSTGEFYTKTKAEKSYNPTLYKKDESCFEIVCDSRGYSEAEMSYYVSSGGGNAGESISKAEFESNY